MPECRSEVEAHPAFCQIVRFRHRPVMHNRARIANRDEVIFPAIGQLFDARYHLPGRQGRPGVNFSFLFFAGGKDLDVGAAHVDDQYIHWEDLRLDCNLACLLEHLGLGRDNAQQFVPGFDKRLGALVLQRCC